MMFIRNRAVSFFAVTLVIIAAAVLALGYSANPTSDARLLHTEPSKFAPVVVFEQYGERCMNFVSVDHPGRQTCFQLNDPNKMVFEYTRMMTSALFVQPHPASILIIGLGGATLPVALHKMLPDAVIDSVEIDPAVVRVAERFFGYETGPRQRVFIEDGREFIEHAYRDGRQYDIVMLDAFDVDYIPAHLLTVEFLQLVRGILSPDGVVVANSATRSTLYDNESATYAAVFGEFFNLRAGLDGNRVIIAAVDTLPDRAQLQRNAQRWASRLKPFGIDADAALARFAVYRQNGKKGTPLRDAPASRPRSTLTAK